MRHKDTRRRPIDNTSLWLDWNWGRKGRIEIAVESGAPFGKDDAPHLIIDKGNALTVGAGLVDLKLGCFFLV